MPKLLLNQLIDTKDPEKVEKSLLNLPGLKRYTSTLPTSGEKEQFRHHFRKYINIYSTDCPFEVSTTNRYTITTYEAAVTARRRIKQGETIKYLTGTLVPLTAEESADLDLTQRNFSIVVSSRKKNSSIFLGPARFANHDCHANGRLVTRGNDGMEVVAMKNIEVGDEITVTYGEDYFGPNNEDCLCHTCEKNVRNGWTSAAAFGAPRSEASTPAQEVNGFYHSGNKRKYEADSATDFSSNLSLELKKRKLDQTSSSLRQALTPPASHGSQRADSVVSDHQADRSTFPKNLKRKLNSTPPLRGPTASSMPHGLSGRRTKLSQEISANDVVTNDGTVLSESIVAPPENGQGPRKRQRLVDMMTASSPINDNAETSLHMSVRRSSSSSDDSATESEASTRTTDATSFSEVPVTVTVKLEVAEVVKLEECGDTIIVDQTKRAPAQATHAVEQEELDSVGSPLTTFSDGEFPDEFVVPTLRTRTSVKTTTVSKTTKSHENILPSVEQSTSTKVSVRNVSDTIRVPGDYILTRKLLAQPFDRWVQCRNCLGYSVQSNGYQTRRECPRCERHSKLYGFTWPKTDPDPRKLQEKKVKGTSPSKFGRKGRCGKGTWVEGGGDPEERVMDHRIVHRFLWPEEERELTRRGLLIAAEHARANGTETPDRALANESMAREESSTSEDGRRRSKRFTTGVRCGV